MKKTIFAALAVVAMASCTKQEGYEVNNSSDVLEMKFTSGIESRVEGSLWEAGDQIGVHALSQDGYTDVNVKYAADRGGVSTNFGCDDSNLPIYFPNEKFFDRELRAYYPYADNFVQESGYGIIDIADQQDLSTVDYMEAEAKTISQEDVGNPIVLNFEHKHTLVTLNVKALGNIESLDGVEFKLLNVQTSGVAGMPVDSSAPYYSEAKFGSVVPAVDVAEDGKSAVINMILFPTADDEPVDALLYFNRYYTSYKAKFCTTLEAGKRQSYNVVIGDDEITIEQSTIQDWSGADDPSTDITVDKDEY